MKLMKYGIDVKTSIPMGAYPPVAIPGLAQKEIIEDNGLLHAKRYELNLMHSECLTLDKLKERYGKPMIEEMVKCIKKHFPDATDSELAITISSHL